MNYFVKSLSEGINLSPETTVEEVMQNVAIILATKKYSVPIDRGLGVSQNFVDKPMPIAQAMIIAEIISAVSEGEPRASVVGVTFTNEADGTLIPVVEVSIDE